MTDYQFWALITGFVIQTGVLFFGGYITKRGQNKADEESLKNLTSIVEEVKTSFIQKNAQVLSELEILKDRRGRHYTQAQQAIISYYTDFSNLFHFMSNTPPLYVVTNELPFRLAEIQKLKYKADVSFNVMELLITSKDLIDEAYNLKDQIFHMQHYYQGYLYQIEIATKGKDRISSIKAQDSYYETSDQDKEIAENTLKSNKEKIENLNQEFFPKLIDFTKSTRVFEHKFRDRAKAFLLS